MAKQTPEEYKRELEGKRGLHSKKWVETRAKEYEERYHAEFLAEVERYQESELVRRAGRTLAEFYIRELIRNIPLNRSQKEISCSLYIKVTERTIVYYDPSKEMSSAIGMRMERSDHALWRELNLRFMLEDYHEINYTGEGWSFESITESEKLRAVTSAIAKTVEGFVRKGIRDSKLIFPDHRNSSVKMSQAIMSGTSCGITITYTAENKYYEA